MTLRIGFDMDGVLADFAAAFGEVEARLFKSEPRVPAGQPEADAEKAAAARPDGTPHPGADDAYESRRRREAVWTAIRSTPNFWTRLS